jgi:hypothetical protein
VQLLNCITGLYEPAEIGSPITLSDIDCYRSDWYPLLNERVQMLINTDEYTREGVLRHNVEDAHWEWPEKFAARAGQLQWNSFALRCGGRTQGLMFVNLIRLCRLPSQENKHMVYVDLVATAPWNRKRLSENPVYKGVGITLVTEAILLSQSEDFGGRVGLHTLPGADEFYRTQFGMESLGADPTYSDLHYLELTTEKAQQFLSE